MTYEFIVSPKETLSITPYEDKVAFKTSRGKMVFLEMSLVRRAAEILRCAIEKADALAKKEVSA